MECALGNNRKTLQGPCVTVTQKEWNSSTKNVKLNGEIMCDSPHNISSSNKFDRYGSSNGKMKGELSTNVWQSSQHNCENGSKESIKNEF